jgi:hypothetical protein
MSESQETTRKPETGGSSKSILKIYKTNVTIYVFNLDD